MINSPDTGIYTAGKSDKSATGTTEENFKDQAKNT